MATKQNRCFVAESVPEFYFRKMCSDPEFSGKCALTPDFCFARLGLKEDMDNLNAQLTRLYLPLGVSADGRVRSIAIPFRKVDGEEGRHWENLCTLANALQQELGLPAPAVSVASTGGYVLWLSLETPVALATAREFLALLARAHPDLGLSPDAAGAPLDLPPRLDPSNGKWSAFIHPGMGASFADESGLDMAPPAAGQAAFLDGLQSAGAQAFQAALATLRQAQATPAPAATLQPAPPQASPATRRDAIPDDLLLKDATLEDIVRFLHARHIEPTFRHLIPPA
jgi:hypothetical protein